MNKKQIYFNRSCRWLLAVILLSITNLTLAEAVVGFDSKQIKVKSGDVFAVDVVLKGFPQTEGGGISLRYDPETLRVVNVAVYENIWGFVKHDGVTDNTAGLVSDILFSSYEGVVGDAPVARIEFEAIARGRSTLELEGSVLNPFASDGKKIAVRYEMASVNVRGGKNRN